MNSEAQRARNKRKRDKLREKRRQNRAPSILRFRLNGTALKWDHLCGLLIPDQYSELHSQEKVWCEAVAKDDRFETHELEWSTEWVYMGTHDVSSSAVDAIQCFLNTWNDLMLHGAFSPTIELVMQRDGETRRKVWRGHTVGVHSVEKAVCSFAKQPSREE